MLHAFNKIKKKTYLKKKKQLHRSNLKLSFLGIAQIQLLIKDISLITIRFSNKMQLKGREGRERKSRQKLTTGIKGRGGKKYDKQKQNKQNKELAHQKQEGNCAISLIAVSPTCFFGP